MKKALPFLSLILGVVLLVIAVIMMSSGSEKDSFIHMVKMLPADIGEFTFIDIGMLRSDDDLASTWEWAQKNLISEDIYGENTSNLTGFGMAGNNSKLILYAGDFDFTQMTSIIEQNSIESFEYEGVTIWTDQYASSTALIDDIVFVGSSDDIQLCVDASNGQGTSLYGNKDAEDAIGRLSGGYVLGVMVVGNDSSSGASYGVLAVGMAVSKKGGNISEISLLKFQDSDAAEQYITNFGSQIPSSYDVTQDGQYLTISSASEIPSPEEESYNSAYSDLQNAVVAYATNNSGVFPTINGTVNISGYDLQIIDICSLLTTDNAVLSEVPEGVASVNGSDNDNCDTGCDGCSDTNHYIWTIDEYGYIFSTCVGVNCSEYNSDGYQGVWP